MASIRIPIPAVLHENANAMMALKTLENMKEYKIGRNTATLF